jgi:DNA transformation protein
MTATAEFADYALELLGRAGKVAARRMFGGYGLYCDGVMFALIADDVLYLRADDANRPALERAGSEPFAYEANGRRAIMAYWRAPDAAMESPELMAPWACAALEAALRARRSAVRKKRRPASKARGTTSVRGSRAGSRR